MIPNNIYYSNNRFGFWDGKFTNNANFLSKQTHLWKIRLELLHERYFCRHKKTFNSVYHNLLLKKLHDARISGIANDLVNSYLNNCIQVVKIDNCFSQPILSIPQGTILGPLFFTM